MLAGIRAAKGKSKLKKKKKKKRGNTATRMSSSPGHSHAMPPSAAIPGNPCAREQRERFCDSMVQASAHFTERMDALQRSLRHAARQGASLAKFFAEVRPATITTFATTLD